MSFIEKLKATVEAMGLPFAYGTAEDLNTLTDNTDMPAVMCYLLQDSQMDYVGAQTCERASVTVFFIDKTSPSYSGLENDAIVQQCKDRADEWIDSIRKGGVFTPFGTVNYRRVYLQFYGVYTGIGVNLTLRENVGWTDCQDDGVFNNVFNEVFA